MARAVAVAVMLGVPRNHAFPFAYAALLRLGVPVRPPHYLSGPTLFVVGALPIFLLLGGLVESGFGEWARFVFFQLIDDAGWPGAVAFALLSGVVNVFYTLAQRRRYRLPAWHTL